MRGVLAAAELFGNRRGYPTAGCRPAWIGGEADGGTLYLDEIGELPPAVQTSLRVIGATNRPLDTLRHDLVARFRHQLAVPGLEERLADVPLLIRHQLLRARREGAPARFFDPNPRMSPRFVRSLLERTWTTHARELDALLWAALNGSTQDHLDLTLPETTEPVEWEPWAGTPPDELPSQVLQACLDDHNGNQEEAWRALNLSSRHVLRRLIQRHGLVVRRRAST